MRWFGRDTTEPEPPVEDGLARHCPNAGACPLFERFRTSPALRVWQRFFCESSFERCARFRQMQCGDSVSPTLLPDGSELEESRPK